MGKFVFDRETAARRLEERRREQTFENLDTSRSGGNNIRRTRHQTRIRNIRSTDNLSYPDEEMKEEYLDVEQPKNLGRRKPLTNEWGDYIQEEQALYLEGLVSGENVKPAGRTRRTKAMREFEERSRLNRLMSSQFGGIFTRFMKVD